MRHRSALGLVALLALFAFGCASQPDTRTNPTVRGASGGVTVTGTVVSFTSDAVVITTTTGRETIQLVEATIGREHLTVGRQVSIDVTRSGQAMVAEEIRAGEPADS